MSFSFNNRFSANKCSETHNFLDKIFSKYKQNYTSRWIKDRLTFAERLL